MENTVFDSYVDPILKALQNGVRKHLGGVMDYHVPDMNGKSERSILRDFLIDNGLVRPCSDNDWEVTITPKGFQIHKTGGWLKYVELLRKEEERHQKTDRNRYWVATGLGVLALIISCIPIGYDIFSDGKIDELKTEVRTQSHKTDSLLKATSSRIDLLETSLKTDSLPK